MPARRRVDVAKGRAALEAWLAGSEDSVTVATAVRFTLEELAEDAPGNAVEVRVPPYGVTQCLEGTSHRRGTPPAVVETTPHVWLALVTGRVSWAEAASRAAVIASGERSDLSVVLPLPGCEAAPGTPTAELPALGGD